jgi:hypothetical protein
LNHFLQRKSQLRPVLLPLLDSLLARIEGKSYEDIIASPGDRAAALLKTMDLLQTDGIIARYDDAILAQAVGTPADEPLQHPGLAAAIETVRRLAAPAGRSYACVAGMAGPGKLARQLFPNGEIEAATRSVKKHYMTVAESCLKTQPDMLLLFEQAAGTDGCVPSATARLYSTLRNQAAYYNVPLAVYFDGYQSDRMEQLGSLKPDVTILGRDVHGAAPGLALALRMTDQAAGIGINLEDAQNAAGMVQEACLACRDGRNLLLTSLDSPGMDMDLNSLRVVFQNCKEIAETKGQE